MLLPIGRFDKINQLFSLPHAGRLSTLVFLLFVMYRLLGILYNITCKHIIFVWNLADLRDLKFMHKYKSSLFVFVRRRDSTRTCSWLASCSSYSFSSASLVAMSTVRPLCAASASANRSSDRNRWVALNWVCCTASPHQQLPMPAAPTLWSTAARFISDLEPLVSLTS